ncbi:MAG: hypothetical protein D6722_22010 [Bacteroidetes bacterium]|nr:MAG: hypothetical protein D6722_22010 [Bacteroidota bacterium]
MRTSTIPKSRNHSVMASNVTHEHIVLDILAACEEWFPAQGGLENHQIVDGEHGHYLFMPVGWYRDRYFYGPLIHFHLRGGNIWVLANHTEIELEKELFARGAQRQDIIAGFQSPSFREMTGWAGH